MSRSHSNYKRTVRRHKCNAQRAGARVNDWMRLRAHDGCPAAQQWCRGKGIDVPSAGNIPPHLRDVSLSTTWWVVSDTGAATVQTPTRVEPHEWLDGLTVQDLGGPHGTAARFYSEAEAEAAYDRLAEAYGALHEARRRDEEAHERRVARARREHAEDMEHLGLGPL